MKPLLCALLISLLSVPTAAQDTTTPQTPKPEPPWKIEDPHGPFKDVAFTTDEGTWIALDVHPDGRTIVFSLLGDLYTLPIEGGAATRITSGTAYDVEPRFSPDGKRIAFATDRSGTENIWTIDTSGGDPRQLSQEKDATVSGPSWSPDGDYIVARKRLTDTSPLGTVELWLWHVKGGDGLRITEKDKQPDAADPAFSPDGRFVTFAARGSRYRYDRSADEGIWQLKRFDRRTGQITDLTNEFGGAAAPRNSPNGEGISYVRRVRESTVLESIDVDTGKIRRITSGLTRDLQQGFAFHGTFPGYSWTPDSKSIIATAERKIWRIDASTGTRTPIPFIAEVSQRVTDALRFTRAVPNDVRARIVRWPVESPDGKRLAFSAVGHVYLMDLPGGSPRRLTDVADLEYSPSWSADGQKLAFVSWNDREGGNVWTVEVNADGTASSPRRITEKPGQYANPAFSPDGRWLVFLRGSGATFRDHDISDELWHEILMTPSTGGASQYVIGVSNRGANRRMARPQFSSDGQRIFFVDNEPAAKPNEVGKTALISVKLDGTDKQTHIRWAKAEEATVSPDGKWVAFSEQHNAYVTAFPKAGNQTVEIALEKSPLPLGKLTDDGGQWVSWSDGGRAVTWSSGPFYHRLSLDKAFPVPDPPGTPKPPVDPAAPPEKKKLPTPQTTEIVLNLPRDVPTGMTAYVGARIVSMRGDEVIEKGVIVVENDRIKAVGARGKVVVPKGAKVVDVSGKTIIPGLFDEHAHLHYSALDIFPQRPWKYLANLAYGVTTTHDPSAATHEALGQSEMVEAGLMVGPRVFSTGYILYGADDPERAVVNSLDDARSHIRRMKRLGAFTVKSYMQPRREQRQWIIQAAREEGVMVVPEGGGDLENDMTMVLDGHTTIEHALPIAPLARDVVTLLGRSGTTYTPTLLVAYGGLSGEHWFYQHYEVWRDERLLRFIPQSVIDSRSRQRLMAPDDAWHHKNVASSARDVMRAGGTVSLGGHGQLQGLGPHWEMWAFVHGGMTPLEAIRVATISGAKTLGMDRDLGSIEAGKLADFVVLDRNPLAKIENSDSVVIVVKNGRPYKPQDLTRINTNR